jgi:hypothetical protein
MTDITNRVELKKGIVKTIEKLISEFIMCLLKLLTKIVILFL